MHCFPAAETLNADCLPYLALGGRLLWWHHDSLLDGLPRQVCPDIRDWLCLSAILAVSTYF